MELTAEGEIHLRKVDTTDLTADYWTMYLARKDHAGTIILVKRF